MKKSKEDRINAFNKLTKCIFSCKTTEQIKSCYKMIEFYNNLFGDHKFDIKSEVDVLKEELHKQEKIVI